MKNVKFLLSPMSFGLGYTPGETGLIDAELAEKLISKGICELLESEVETAEAKPKNKVEKAVK